MRALLFPFAVATALAACGDDLEAPLQGDIAARLAALPGVTATEWIPPADWPVHGLRYFDLEITQPLDHAHPETGTYQQYAALIHRGDDAPVVIYAGGYNATRTRGDTEPTALLGANQLSLEYRFYGDSRNAGTDWNQLDVDQAQADQHAVAHDLARVYPGSARIATGGSKGGENALQALRSYPGDYDGVVAYVAPVITDLPDLRYAHVLEDIGVPECHDKLRAVQHRMLELRTSMEMRAAGDGTYEMVGLGKATETAIVELEFSYWMTLLGGPDCTKIPPPTASADVLFGFLDQVSSPSGYDDDSQLASGMQYTWQLARELGYPVWEHAHLDDVMMYSYEDWTPMLPPGVANPSYDPSVARDLADWVTHDARHVILLDGEWDPWGAGYPASVAADHDAYRLVVPHGSHWSSGIYSLPAADQQVALEALSRWARTPIDLSARVDRALPELGPPLPGPDGRAGVVGVRGAR